MAQQPDSDGDGKGPGGGAGADQLAQDLRRAQADCLELLESNRRLREAGHRKDDLLALCAHDLRQPLTVLLGQARLLLSGARGALLESQRKGVEAVERQGRRLLELADDLAGLGSLEVGRLGVEREAVDLGRLCNEVADRVAPALRDKGGALTRTVPAYPLVLRLDVEKLRRALTLLFSQAILLAPRGGRLDLSLEPVREGARISLALGVSEGASRAPRTRPRPRSGAASELGLAICRELVELNGGALETEPVERGLRFSVVLPLAGDGAGGARPVAGAPGRPRVLVVEDEADQRDALAELLEMDYQVATARDGEEGVRVARADPPDLILMDLVMPRMDGFAALEALRGDHRTAEIPVIFVSARGDDVTRVKGLDLGAVDFLAKPFSERELKARIERTLRLSRRQTQLRQLAQTDTLTGLANLRAFRARLEEESKRAQRYGTPLTCVMADMDYLKPVNDQLGHAAGDRAIASVADVVRTELRETDFAARYGGDEFVVLLPHTTESEGRVFAERVCHRLRETTLEVTGRPLALAASFGVAELGPGASDQAAEELVQRADEALYAAKRAGRGRVAVAGAPHPRTAEAPSG
ncbi:MAG TPA: diguanylate cyclase [Anaeromyxobacteraceae bacterium]|nr:diguanylate cyclase [Anaeromyxobacteraceae bacterium]